MLTDYLPIVVMAGLAAVFAVGSLVASSMLRPHHPNPVKSSAYESGNDPVRLPRGERFSVKFYVVALVFVAYAYIWRKGGFDWAYDVTPNEPEEVAERESELEEATRAG